MSIICTAFDNLKQFSIENIHATDVEVVLELFKDDRGVYHGNPICVKIEGGAQEVDYRLTTLPQQLCECGLTASLKTHPLTFKLGLRSLLLPIAVASAGIKLTSEEVADLKGLYRLWVGLKEMQEWYINFYPTLDDLDPLIVKLSAFPNMETVLSSLSDKYREVISDKKTESMLLEALEERTSLTGVEAKKPVVFCSQKILEPEAEDIVIVAKDFYFEDFPQERKRITGEDEVLTQMVKDCFLSGAYIKTVPKIVEEAVLSVETDNSETVFITPVGSFPSAAEIEIANGIYPTLEGSPGQFLKALQLAKNI